MNDEKVLIVIPAYNEEASIAAVILRLRQIVPQYDRVIVNDGSTDKTGKVVDTMGEKQLKLPCNIGYGMALQTGLKYGLIKGYDVIISLDADGQHQPEDVPRLVEFLNSSDVDMVIGSRFCETKAYDTPYYRRMGQLFFSHLTKMFLGYRIYDTSSGFKALRASACKVVVDGIFMDFHIETIVQMSLLNLKIKEFPIIVLERTAGQSMHSLASVFQYPIKTILLTITVLMDAILIRRVR
jgi:glycosyltransferase involved in cell wall biosynthesis